MFGRVYKIVSSKTDEIYIGSTFRTLQQRFQLHKNMNGCSSNILFEKYGVDSCTIQLIKVYQVCDELHLQAYEQLWINKYKDKVVNKSSSFSIKKLYKKQYYEEHKEEILNQNKKYRENNREEIRNQNKKYYEKNREEILNQNKKHYEKNREEIRNQNKKYRENNRDKILEKFDCECEGKYVYSDKSRHFKTKKHQDYIKKKNH